MTIHSLQREMSYTEALRNLSPCGPWRSLHRWISGPLRGIAEMYIPYRLYGVSIDDRRFQNVRHYAVDAATGTLDPYEFPGPLSPHELVEVETRNFHPARLNQIETQNSVTERVRRLVYSRGFFRLANPNIRAALIQSEFYIPYWVGFYGDQKNLSLTVLNAVRQTTEGNKARRLVRRWLLEHDPQREIEICAPDESDKSKSSVAIGVCK